MRLISIGLISVMLALITGCGPNVTPTSVPVPSPTILNSAKTATKIKLLSGVVAGFDFHPILDSEMPVSFRLNSLKVTKPSGCNKLLNVPGKRHAVLGTNKGKLALAMVFQSVTTTDYVSKILHRCPNYIVFGRYGLEREVNTVLLDSPDKEASEKVSFFMTTISRKASDHSVIRNTTTHVMVARHKNVSVLALTFSTDGLAPDPKDTEAVLNAQLALLSDG